MIVFVSTVVAVETAVNARISAAVAALVRGQRRDVGEIAREMGLSRTALYQKIKGDRPFKAWEVAALAAIFGVRVSDLYDGLGGRVGPQLVAETGNNVATRRAADAASSG